MKPAKGVNFQNGHWLYLWFVAMIFFSARLVITSRELLTSDVPVFQHTSSFLPSNRSECDVAVAVSGTTLQSSNRNNAAVSGSDSEYASLDHRSPTTRYPNVAVVLISMGGLARTYEAERVITSLRTRGQWDGPIMLLTDSAKYFTNLTRVNRGPPSQNLQVVQVDEADMWKNLTNSGSLKFKRFKMLQLKYLDRLSTLSSRNDIDSVVFIDIDVLVGQQFDEVLGYFMRWRDLTLEPVNKPGDKDMSYMWAFGEPNPRFASEPAHTAVLFLDRVRSATCLELWLQALDSNKYKRDQAALAEVITDHKKECRVIVGEMEPWFTFPTKESMLRSHASVFVHVTNSWRARSIPKDVQQQYYSDIFGIDNSTMFQRKPKR